MPGSMVEGKYFIKNFFLGKKLGLVLDVGPGSGNYYDLFNGQGEYTSPDHVSVLGWTAVEIFAPYIDSFNLRAKYDEIIVADIRYINWDSLGTFDVIILGDVLEHMYIGDAKEVIKEAANHATWVVISLPIVYYPQGESYGNKHEAHLEHWTHDAIMRVIKPYGVIDYSIGEVVGAYIIKGKIIYD